MDSARKTDDRQMGKGGPNPGLLRPPVIFLAAIGLGILLNWCWPLHSWPSILW